MADKSSVGPGVLAARRKMESTGFTGAGQPLWSKPELRALHRYWPDRKRLARAIPRRTIRAIERKGEKLGLSRSKRTHTWTCAQVERLKRMWPVATRDELLAAFPWAIWEDLMNKAQDLRRREHLALARPKPRVAPTGVELVDQIIARAHLAKLTLRDLDRRAGTGTYFQKGRFRRSVALRHIAPAAEVLGGELGVAW